jgi:ABC-2 type transport system permease protein
MQGQLTSHAGAVQPAAAGGRYWLELGRGAWTIFAKHMRKFASSTMEIGGTLGWPLLWVLTFGVGMEQVVNVEALGGVESYLAFITPGIIALTAMSGAVNAGMVLLEEKIKGIIKEYFVAPVPRLSILLASTGSGLVKTLLQSAIILAIAIAMGARLAGGMAGLLGAILALLLYVAAFVGFSNGMAVRSKSIGGYHTMLFMLNLPLLFLSNAFYPLDAMPEWMRVIAYLNPTTYVVDALRQTLYRSGELSLLLSFAVLAVCAVLLNWFGLRSFRRLAQGE